MKSVIFFGISSLASAAMAQISVVGVSMVSVDPSADAASADAYGAPTPAPTAYGTDTGAASQVTAPPSTSMNFYDMMPYSSYQSGGYKSLDCGYGYSKQSDGSCMPESWVSALEYGCFCFFFL